MDRIAPELADIRHIKLCYSKDRYCGHPRQSGIFNYGNGEIAVLHSHAPSRYQVVADIDHSFTTGYASRATILLQRSLDGGETWPTENDVVVWDESRSLEEKRAILHRADEPGVAREQIDLTSPDAAVYFTRAATGPSEANWTRILECFAFRSGDRGRTWEMVPTRGNHPNGGRVSRDAHPLVQFPDGTVMGAMYSRGPASGAPYVVSIYGSDDNGLTWEYVAEVARDPTGLGLLVYSGLLLLPSGRLQCYMLSIGGMRNAIQMAHSDDGGYSWSRPKPIVAWGRSPWAARRKPEAAVAKSDEYIYPAWPGDFDSPLYDLPVKEDGSYFKAVAPPGSWWGAPGVHYRSPWPMRLRDGQIVVLFARRKRPAGIGLIVSEDEGSTWSAEAIVRDDASGGDLGYPVATQLDDGRIFTAYYFMEDDGNNFGGTRHIAGSFFRLA